MKRRRNWQRRKTAKSLFYGLLRVYPTSERGWSIPALTAVTARYKGLYTDVAPISVVGRLDTRQARS